MGVFSQYKAAWLPQFERLLPKVSQLLEPARPWSDLQWGLCIFDDLVEYTGPECQKYEGLFLARMLACVSSPQPEVRQAAAYGCGVLGQFGGPGFAGAAAQAVPLLSEVIMDQILPMWFSWLPVTEDVDEAPFVYNFLADLVEANNPHVLGVNNSSLPRIVAI